MESQMHLVEKRLNLLPEYVTEYIDYIARKNAESTLLSYCKDFIIFFDWLVAEGISPGPSSKEVSLETLEKLRVMDVIRFQNHCQRQLNNSKDSIARKISAMKSMFHYLAQIAEDDDLYPYLKRNVMAKIEIEKQKVTDTEKAENISGKILIDEEIGDFREYIAEGLGKHYEDMKLTRKLSAYKRNRTRDLAIVSLILGSGLRISEAVSLDMDSIDWKKQHVLVTRKGGKKDVVAFSDIALYDMYEYAEIRSKEYKPDKNENAFFLSSPTRTGKSERIKVRTCQKMIEKYVQGFGKGQLTLHKLRHTFATNHYKHNKDIASLKRQLGHTNINTTMIYTHVLDNTLKDSVNKADK